MPNIQQRISSVPQSAKQVTQGLAQIAMQNAKQAGETAKAQIGVASSEKNNDLDFFEDEEMPSVLGSLKSQTPPIDTEAIHAKERALLSDLESQLKVLREKRDRDLAAYNEMVAREMQQKQAMQAQQESAEPQGKIKKAMGKVKKAVSSIMGRKQGETKQGSGKG